MNAWINKKLLSAFALVLVLLALGAGAAFGVGSLARRKDIGKTAAEQYAIADAGVDSSGVFLKRTELELEGGRAVYEVEFISGNKEYDYTIDAASGKILFKDFDIEGFDIGAAFPEESLAEAILETQETIAFEPIPETQAAKPRETLTRRESVQAAAPTEMPQPDLSERNYTISYIQETETLPPIQNLPMQESTQHIGVDRAKTIAVAQAGLDMGSVHFLKAKLDNDDGRYEYEIEFYHGNLEYEVSIDAISGAVLEFSADSD